MKPNEKFNRYGQKTKKFDKDWNSRGLQTLR